MQRLLRTTSTRNSRSSSVWHLFEEVFKFPSSILATIQMIRLLIATDTRLSLPRRPIPVMERCRRAMFPPCFPELRLNESRRVRCTMRFSVLGLRYALNLSVFTNLYSVLALISSTVKQEQSPPPLSLSACTSVYLSTSLPVPFYPPTKSMCKLAVISQGLLLPSGSTPGPDSQEWKGEQLDVPTRKHTPSVTKISRSMMSILIHTDDRKPRAKCVLTT